MSSRPRVGAGAALRRNDGQSDHTDGGEGRRRRNLAKTIGTIQATQRWTDGASENQAL